MDRARHVIKSSYHASKRQAKRVHHHPAGLPVVLFALLAFVGIAGVFFGLRHNARQLTIVPNQNFIVLLNVDGKRSTLPTDADTVGDLLKKLSITLGENDRVEPDSDEPIRQDKFRVNIYRAAPVFVSDGISTYTTVTAAATPRGMVAKSGVTLYPEDRVTVSAVDNLVLQQAIGLRAVITRATPVNVGLYGAPAVVMRTQTKTVGDFIREKKIVVTPVDTVKPALTTPISQNMQIDVIRNGLHTITVSEDVSPPVQTVTDTALSFGATAVRQEGVAGKRTNTYEINVQDGTEVSRKLLQSVTVTEPVPRIVARGTAVYVSPDKTSLMAAAGISPDDYGAVDYIVSHEGGWCPFRWQGDRGCTDHGSAPSSGGYGMFQATPGYKMASAGADWLTNPVTQIRWATGYAVGRYGSWQGAYNYWVSHHWW